MTLDRRTAREVLSVPMREQPDAIESVLDMLEACVQPADGIVLTREEAALAREWFATLRNKRWESGADLALAEKLEGKP